MQGGNVVIDIGVVAGVGDGVSVNLVIRSKSMMLLLLLHWSVLSLSLSLSGFLLLRLWLVSMLVLMLGELQQLPKAQGSHVLCLFLAFQNLLLLLLLVLPAHASLSKSV